MVPQQNANLNIEPACADEKYKPNRETRLIYPAIDWLKGETAADSVTERLGENVNKRERDWLMKGWASSSLRPPAQHIHQNETDHREEQARGGDDDTLTVMTAICHRLLHTSPLSPARTHRPWSCRDELTKSVFLADSPKLSRWDRLLPHPTHLRVCTSQSAAFSHGTPYVKRSVMAEGR